MFASNFSSTSSSSTGYHVPPPQGSQNTGPAHEHVFELNFVCRPNPRPSILNSTVVGRDGFTPYFHIMSTSERTVFRTNEGRTVAQIDWRANSTGGSPYVEVRNAVAKQRVSRWLPVSADGSYRIMTVQRSRYVWVPQTDCICMYNWNPEMFENVPQLLARMENPNKGQNQTVKFEIAVEAMNRGLLEMTVVAATLFQAGRPID
ncbi:hypothetical protein R3P38DRAFT_71964 [Favolaschia claudopus]|uniref:DUF6593 domain-containing protein n=1 Tax=Favolaschia claudopus TaxID=2862362 RepID=A0AAW0D6H7_9AGAR